MYISIPWLRWIGAWKGVSDYSSSFILFYVLFKQRLLTVNAIFLKNELTHILPKSRRMLLPTEKHGPAAVSYFSTKDFSEGHVKLVTNEKSRKDRSRSKGVTISHNKNIPRKEGHNRDVST